MRDASPPLSASKGRKLAAWAVHGLTAAGAGFGFLALVSVTQGDVRSAWLLLGIALLIDGIDGSLARAVGVKDVVPNINGTLLDLIVDYLNYVIVPVVFLFQFEMLPNGYLSAGCIFILITSLYAFCREDLMASDHCFRGFPAVWNVVIYFFYVLETSQYANLVAVAVLGVLTFAPIKAIHPVRVVELRKLNLFMLTVWAAVSLIFLLSLPIRLVWAQYILALVGLYFLGVGMWITIRTRGSK